MKQILLAVTNPQPPTADTEMPTIEEKSRRVTQTAVTSASDIRPSKEIIYETPKREPVREDDDDYDDEFLEEDAKKFGRENVGSVTSPYLMPCLQEAVS